MRRPVRSLTSLPWPCASSAVQRSAVRRSCQTMARWIAWPVRRSQTRVVSRWLVMPIAAISPARASARASACRQTDSVESQRSSASCSTQPEARIMLREFLLGAGDRLQVLVEQDGARRCRALVDRQDHAPRRHAVSPIARCPARRPGHAELCREGGMQASAAADRRSSATGSAWQAQHAVVTLPANGNVPASCWIPAVAAAAWPAKGWQVTVEDRQDPTAPSWRRSPYRASGPCRRRRSGSRRRRASGIPRHLCRARPRHQ